MPVFTHERINDFRETGDQLVVVVEEGDASKVLVIGKDGSEPRELALPGDGYVSAVQVSDRGSLVGFVYSDRDLTEVTGRASVLVTQPLSGEGSRRSSRSGRSRRTSPDGSSFPIRPR
ncbi:hypothetical protein [Microbacterium sp. NIBRBAC000506063]|uniref:hypothetical protein n=1 Tax=Microbacterium sp. NIBRBAC000506063 TaxID=2734618 RepID=UPI001BB58A41|nr:hypothetical protein [Microbacterium sp. NIBRBAC000506063]QTV80537.1 hypothetical protein KAE78_06625 [Microbacterium sp. NIBRBAC000506063]